MEIMESDMGNALVVIGIVAILIFTQHAGHFSPLTIYRQWQRRRLEHKLEKIEHILSERCTSISHYEELDRDKLLIKIKLNKIYRRLGLTWL